MAGQSRGEATRAHILDAAEECFARQGYDATGVAEICRCAGVSKGAFYHHFSSKQEVFTQLLARWLGGLDDEMAAIRDLAASTPDALLRLTEMAPAVFQMADTKLPIFLEFWSKAAREPAVRKATVAYYQQYEEFFTAMIQRGIDEGAFRPMDARSAARTFISLGLGLIIQSVLGPEGAQR